MVLSFDGGARRPRGGFPNRAIPENPENIAETRMASGVVLAAAFRRFRRFRILRKVRSAGLTAGCGVGRAAGDVR